MVEAWGAAKAHARVDGGHVESRPDKYTGLKKKEHGEFKLVVEEGEDMEVLLLCTCLIYLIASASFLFSYLHISSRSNSSFRVASLLVSDQLFS